MGARAGALLTARRELVAVAETSAGGLVSASLLAVPGASRYFAGGAVTYSARSIRGLAGISIEEMRAKGIRSSSEPYAELLAAAIRARHGTIAWGLSETGAAGPEGNSYGDPAGHSCMAVCGKVNAVRTLRTRQNDRLAICGPLPKQHWLCSSRFWNQPPRRAERRRGECRESCVEL